MDHYSKARREGLRVYQNAIQSNTDPYLPVLEERVPALSSLSRLSLGIMTISLDRVIGSVSRGRSYAFANGFMPILEGGSEFASKWEHLCESVEAKGVNQPITVLEYMGYYYVIEGNKRASVMKYLDARAEGKCKDSDLCQMDGTSRTEETPAAAPAPRALTAALWAGFGGRIRCSA